MTAKDLLHLYVEYKQSWEGMDAKPAKVRYDRLMAMQKAFGLAKPRQLLNPERIITTNIRGTSESLTYEEKVNKLSQIEYFEQGEFLNERPYEQNQEVINMAMDNVNKHFPKLRKRYLKKPVDIRWLYNRLLLFRLDIHRFTIPEAGFLEGFSVGLFLGMVLMDDLKGLIKEKLTPIDDLIHLILDPEKKEASLDTLVKKYNYPDVDLASIDRKFEVDNY